MPLADCIKQLAAELAPEDISAIEDRVNAGMPEPDAVLEQLASIDHEIDNLAAKIESHGVSLNRAPIEALKQEGVEGEPPRGDVSFTAEGATIRLFERMDLSTTLHEAAHVFLEMERVFAEDFGVNEVQQKALDWLGVESFDAITREQHEKWAEAFETYLYEGKAPTSALQAAFSQFRSWLTSAYRNAITAFGQPYKDTKINKDVRYVFDRLLAVEAELDGVFNSPEYEQLFRSKEQLGMTDADWEQYQKKLKKRKEAASETLTEKALRTYINKRKAEWKREKAPLIEEEKDRIRQTQPFQILQAARDSKVNYDELVEALRELNLVPEGTSIMKAIGAHKLSGNFSKEGVSLNEFAESFGMSVEEVLKTLREMPKLQDAAEVAAEERMVQRYGDIFNDGSLERELREAVTNDAEAELLLFEVQALRKKAKSKDAIDRDFLKAEAKRKIGELAFSEIQPYRFLRTMQRAAVKAAKATNPQEQYEAKVQQLANHYLFREATKTREQMAKDLRAVRKYQKRNFDPKVYDAGHANLIQRLSRMYDFRYYPKSAEGTAHRKQVAEELLNWIHTNDITADQEKLDRALYDVNLVDALYARDRGEYASYEFPTFEEMTASQINGVRAQLDHLAHLGRRMGEAEMAQFRENRDRLYASIRDFGGKDRAISRTDQFAEIREAGWQLMRGMLSLRNLTRLLDGFNEEGLAWKYLYRPLEDGMNKKYRLGREVYNRFEREVGAIHRLNMSKKRLDFKLESGETANLHMSEIFMMAAYWGTESSREAIRRGHGMTDNDVMAILSTLSNEHLQVVNAVWGMNESLWPELSEAGMRRNGAVPPKLDATPFEVNGVKMTGGHMRLFYDADMSKMTDEEAVSFTNSQVMPSKASSLIARVGSGGRKVLLDPNNIVQSLDEMVHYIAFADAGYELARYINSPDFNAIVDQKHGRDTARTIINTIQGVSINKQQQDMHPAISKILRTVRVAATFKHLAFSLRNTIQQVPAIAYAANEVGTGAWMREFSNMLANWEQYHEFIGEHSAFMESRASTVNREAAGLVKQLSADSSLKYYYMKFGELGFAPQTIVDKLISMPVWMAKYQQALEQGMSEKDAVSTADTAVHEAVGSGSDLHLSGLFQSNNPEVVKSITLFGSWFNAMYQRGYRHSEGFSNFRNMDFWYAMLTTPFIVAVASAVLVMDFPDEGTGDEEDQTAPGWMFEKYRDFSFGYFPIIRDVASTFNNYRPSTPLMGAIGAPRQAYNAIDKFIEGEKTGVKTLSDITKATTSLVPTPGIGNVTRVLDYLDSLYRGEETNVPTGGLFNLGTATYQALVEGPDRDK